MLNATKIKILIYAYVVRKILSSSIMSLVVFVELIWLKPTYWFKNDITRPKQPII